MYLGRAVILLAIITFSHKSSGHDQCSWEHFGLGIIHGHAVPIQDAPYMVALQNGATLEINCGATIIHERFLLSAAHCATKDPVLASMGSERYRRTNKNTIIEVEKFIPHENYTYESDNDISLVKLVKPIPFGKNIAKITLADKNMEIKGGTMANVTGWGRTENDLALDLQQGAVPILSQECCQETVLSDTELCAGLKGQGACHGDSGGPLSIRHDDVDIQVGIVSRGAYSSKDCGEGLDVYTRVSSFRDWIEENIQKNL